uniref:CAP-Lyc-1 n=1 Tax=Lychas buchari TaxID=1330406 RepID=T1DPC1_9SCOR
MGGISSGDVRLHALALLLLAVGWAGAVSHCPALYLRYSNRHTFCQSKNDKCQIKRSGVTLDERDTILELHNSIRNEIALGKDASGKRLPHAGNMLEMEWDEELAQVAQKLADRCIFNHDCDECRKVENFDVGQNLYTATVTATKPPHPSWKDAIQAWYSEVHRFSNDLINPFTSDDATGHFTQMVWSNTWKIGCGFVSYEKRKDSWTQLYVCNYGPGGNVDDDEMYMIAQACSKCPGNTCCGMHCKKRKSPSYVGLCKVLNEKGPDYDEGDFSHFVFNCDFKTESTSDCQIHVDGTNKWQTRQVVSGVYKTVVLNGGESTTLKFTSHIQSKDGFCLTIAFRKGPNVAGAKNANEFSVQLERKGATKPLNFQLDSEGSDWLPYSIGIPMKQPMQISLKFGVPKGAPTQYLDVKYVRARPGLCS